MMSLIYPTEATHSRFHQLIRAVGSFGLRGHTAGGNLNHTMVHMLSGDVPFSGRVSPDRWQGIRCTADSRDRNPNGNLCIHTGGKHDARKKNQWQQQVA